MAQLSSNQPLYQRVGTSMTGRANTVGLSRACWVGPRTATPCITRFLPGQQVPSALMVSQLTAGEHSLVSCPELTDRTTSHRVHFLSYSNRTLTVTSMTFQHSPITTAVAVNEVMGLALC